MMTSALCAASRPRSSASLVRITAPPASIAVATTTASMVELKFAAPSRPPASRAVASSAAETWPTALTMRGEQGIKGKFSMVPYPAGGSNDIFARALGQKLAEPVVL